MTSSKIITLAETMRLAARTYDHGNQETALKLIGLVASKIQTPAERRELNQLVKSTLRQSEAWFYYQSIVLGASETVPKNRVPIKLNKVAVGIKKLRLLCF